MGLMYRLCSDVCSLTVSLLHVFSWKRNYQINAVNKHRRHINRNTDKLSFFHLCRASAFCCFQVELQLNYKQRCRLVDFIILTWNVILSMLIRLFHFILLLSYSFIFTRQKSRHWVLSVIDCNSVIRVAAPPGGLKRELQAELLSQFLTVNKVVSITSSQRAAPHADPDAKLTAESPRVPELKFRRKCRFFTTK